jgi:hypothetical protein
MLYWRAKSEKLHYRKYSTDPGFGGIGILAEDHLSELPEAPEGTFPSNILFGQHMVNIYLKISSIFDLIHCVSLENERGKTP